MENTVELSPEQRHFVEEVRAGKNVLVDACIGSGKTTAIQHLCNILPAEMSILYLTYNRLLKLDAKARIHRKNTTVTNYHGFAYSMLRRKGITASMSDLIQRFNHEKPPLDHYDLLILDEYQDIEQELSELLDYVKASNPGMQIVAVGDMCQKIYDKTTLSVRDYVEGFLGDHVELEFTCCFRLSTGLADFLSRIWQKPIHGVNEQCTVEVLGRKEAAELLARQKPGDILCLGCRTGPMADTLNQLEMDYPETFNKETVFASISDRNGTGSTAPKADSAIFTTFDSSKGLERKICVVFDFDESYWRTRITKPQQSYEILRNIFCVAASRGKEKVIFVSDGEALLSEETLSTPPDAQKSLGDLDISGMFDFKYKEAVENCYRLLQIRPLVMDDRSTIDIPAQDGLIDLSPCIGRYQEAMFFQKHSIDTDLIFYFELHPEKTRQWAEGLGCQTLEEKILYLTYLETGQRRYHTQVRTPFVSEEERERLRQRLFHLLTPEDEVQVPCRLEFADETGRNLLFSASGLCDALREDTVYELKFVSELTHEHFLQCACYMAAMELPKGILWNVRTNTLYEIRIPERQDFLNAVVRAVSKGKWTAYHPMKKPSRLSQLFRRIHL